MKQLPVKQAESLLKRALKRKTNQKITLLTKKKDRSLTIEVQPPRLNLVEDGYIQTTRSYQLGAGAAKHALQAAFKREFPRSHQVYVSKS